MVAGAAAGLGVIGLGGAVWAGAMIMGVALIIGAVLRLIVSTAGAGALAVRTRKTDALVLAALGAALVAGSLSLLLPLHDT